MHRALSLLLIATSALAEPPCTPSPPSASVEVHLRKGSRLKELAAWYRQVTCDEVHAPLSAADAPLTLALEGTVPAFQATEVLRAGAASAGYEVRAARREVTLEKAQQPCEPAKARALLERTATLKDCALDLDAFGRLGWDEVCVEARVTLQPTADGKPPWKVTELAAGSLLWAMGLRVGDVIAELPESAYRRSREPVFELQVTRGKEAKRLRCAISTDGLNARLHPAVLLRAAVPPAPTSLSSSCALAAADLTQHGDTVEIAHGKAEKFDPACLATEARLVPAFKDGAPMGFKLFAIRRGSLLAAFGFQNGDVVRAINDRELLNPQDALAATEALKGAKKFVVKLERRGEPATLTIVVK